MLCIGILLPRSNIFPSFGIDILNGLKEFLKSQQVYNQFKLVTDNISYGINEAEVYTKAEKMLLQDDADVVILCADVRAAEMLQPLFTASNKILLVLNTGANFPESWQPAPTTITHSLNFCTHTMLTGKLAALETNKNAINTVSYYDAGYRQCFSMLSSHQANGGIPMYTHVTDARLEAFTVEPVAAFLEATPDIKTLLCLFSCDQAEKFYQQIAALQKKYDLNLFVSPMMFEESLIASLQEVEGIKNVKGYIPWHSSLTNEANRSFKNVFTGKPNYFSLLGWESGMLLQEILKQSQTGNTNATSLIQALTGLQFDSPRGWIKIDKATQHSFGPAYLASLKDTMQVSVDERTATGENEWNEFIKFAVIKGDYSGWRNTYLCI